MKGKRMTPASTTTPTQEDAYAAIPALKEARKHLVNGNLRFANDLVSCFERSGKLSTRQAPWVGVLIERADLIASPLDETRMQPVGDVTALRALFDRAAVHLRHPSVIINVPEIGFVKVYVSNAKSQFAGATMVSEFKSYPGYPGFTKHFGIITKDGKLVPRRDVPTPPTLLEGLKDFAADPLCHAKEYGKLTGRCCFCRLRLTDERSTAAGYGEICAGKWNLPWGERPAKGTVFLASDTIGHETETKTDDSFLDGLEVT